MFMHGPTVRSSLRCAPATLSRTCLYRSSVRIEPLLKTADAVSVGDRSGRQHSGQT